MLRVFDMLPSADAHHNGPHHYAEIEEYETYANKALRCGIQGIMDEFADHRNSREYFAPPLEGIEGIRRNARHYGPYEAASQ